MLTNFMSYISAGGPIILILLALSLVSLTLIAIKIIELWNATSGVTSRSVAISRWSDSPNDAKAHLEHGKSPADRVAVAAMNGIAQNLPRNRVEAEVERLGNQEANRMSRYLRTLEVIAMVSPLLGLLGTVLGMIQSFQELELAEGAANASVLAGGIWQALLTTAAGLIVAIPAAVGANMLAGKVEQAIQNIENATNQILNLPDPVAVSDA